MKGKTVGTSTIQSGFTHIPTTGTLTDENMELSNGKWVL